MEVALANLTFIDRKTTEQIARWMRLLQALDASAQLQFQFQQELLALLLN